eukprot:COSAG01_NODE_66230_length_270_cov_18.906433_1_plen_56_part_01
MAWKGKCWWIDPRVWSNKQGILVYITEDRASDSQSVKTGQKSIWIDLISTAPPTFD